MISAHQKPSWQLIQHTTHFETHSERFHCLFRPRHWPIRTSPSFRVAPSCFKLQHSESASVELNQPTPLKIRGIAPSPNSSSTKATIDVHIAHPTDNQGGGKGTHETHQRAYSNSIVIVLAAGRCQTPGVSISGSCFPRSWLDSQTFQQCLFFASELSLPGAATQHCRWCTDIELRHESASSTRCHQQPSLPSIDQSICSLCCVQSFFV